ncbi:MAG: DUF2207 domain-containing protein, partial [Candidatus Saccharibacteria bacterium]|nr:DUF2207 domain-containing protein [Candidatus Saccharibacteria bacterium]
MKKGLKFHYSILLMFCQVGGMVLGLLWGGSVVFAADVDNFYFESFEADYYLSREYDETSRLEVVETLVAVFPNYEQNKGICREIPFTNQDGGNVTLMNLNRSKIKVTKNGVSAPIYSIDKNADHYRVCTRTDEYVFGRQEYTFEYEFENVVTEPEGIQELYWDTNGNGWDQRFDSVTARVHFDDEISDNYTGKAWCYVGKYGESGQERCKIREISDGFEFSTRDLKKGENLTFDVEIEVGTFLVPEPIENYILMVVLGIVGVICAAFLIPAIVKYLKSRKKISYYNNYFVKPEYQPHPKYSLAEMAEVYIGKKKDFRTGMLLDMIVKGRVTLIKRQSQIFKSSKWAILVKDLAGARIEELALLAILNGGDEVEVGDTIQLRARTADTMMIRLARKIESTVLADLKRDRLVEAKYKMGAGLGQVSVTLGMVLFWTIFVVSFAIPMISVFTEEVFIVGKLVGKEFFLPAAIAMIVVTVVVRMNVNKKVKKIAGHTLLGLETSRYMDGLEMYIRMAEAERIKFLQSVEGVDVSPGGIVKLNEKLLPYAAIFGLEKSWAGELEKYYAVHGSEAPEWYRSGYTTSDLIITTRLAAGHALRSSHYASSGGRISGGGGFSSSSSGGGGGGFSGGGGGGGGGG